MWDARKDCPMSGGTGKPGKAWVGPTLRDELSLGAERTGWLLEEPHAKLVYPDPLVPPVCKV